MRTRSLLLSLLVSALFAGSCSSGAPTATCTGDKVATVGPGRVLVAIDLGYPPFAFADTDGTPQGFEIDLVTAVAKRLRLSVTLANRGSGALISGVIAHRHDLAVAGLRDTSTLRGEACVSSSYLSADLGILVPHPDPHDIKGVSDLDGRRVGVLRGGRGESWAKEHLRASTVAVLPATDDLLEALRQEQLDAIVDELPVVRFAAHRNDRFAVGADIKTGGGYVMAGAPNNAALIAKVDEALAKLKSNGTLTRLQYKWFGP